MRSTLLFKSLVLLAATPALLSAQAAQGQQAASSGTNLPVYDVVSIKPNKSGSGSSGIDSNSAIGSYIATNTRLRRLIEDAYGVKAELISGVPKSIDDARFDVTAKVVDPDVSVLKKVNAEQRQLMLQPYLRDRFHLVVHTETKTLPVYDLVASKEGIKFKESADSGKESTGTTVHNQMLTAHGVSMASFANTLFQQVHRTVIDKTGLTGRYDLALKWSLEDSPDAVSDAAPGIFTALREQLGLKLEPAKGPVVTLVVDHVEMPSEN